MTSGSLLRQVRDRVLTLSRSAAPDCRRHEVVNTEILDLHRNGKVAAEQWTVERCGRRAAYVVNYAPSRPGPARFTVLPAEP